MTTPVALLELQVWASRALIAAGFPGGAVNQAARLVVLAQTVDEDATAGLVADLPGIAAGGHGVPELGEGGHVDGRGLHALAVVPGVLDLACAGRAGEAWTVTQSPGGWVLPGVALLGADRGRAILVVAPDRAMLASPDRGGIAWAEGRGEGATQLAEAALPGLTVPRDGFLVIVADRADLRAARRAADRAEDAPGHGERLARLRREGFTMPRVVWDGLTSWGWKMLVPTSDRSKSQAGGNMDEG